MAMEGHIYEKLDSDKREIRVAILKPGEGDQDVSLVLVTAPIKKIISYEALSNTWGDPAITRTATVSGQPFEVTENLYAALRPMRYPEGLRTLWIDALCINQVDVAERNS